MASSELELYFLEVWKVINPDILLIAEYKFLAKRKFRFDFAHLSSKVAIELQGGIWSRGRHSGGAGQEKDFEKFNLAALDGWFVFQLSHAMITDEWLTSIGNKIRA